MEIWKSTTVLPGLFEVSNLGNVKCKSRNVIGNNGGVRFFDEKIQKQRLNRDGYYRLTLKGNGKRIDVTTHKLVAIAFIPNEENKPFVNHKNGIKTDNRVENLEWCSASENVTHAVKNRLIKTKLTDEQAKEIFNSQLSHRKLAKLYNITSGIVWRIKNKKAYKHLW